MKRDFSAWVIVSLVVLLGSLPIAWASDAKVAFQVQFRDSHTDTAVVPSGLLVDGVDLADKCDANGAAQLQLSPGEHQFTIQAAGYADLHARQIALAEDTTLNVMLLDPLDPPIDALPDAAAKSDAGMLVGYVVDDQSSQPIEGALVEVVGTELRAVSNSRGFFSLTVPLPDGLEVPDSDPPTRFAKRTLSFQSKGHVGQSWQDVLVMNGQCRILRCRMQSGDPSKAAAVVDDRSTRGKLLQQLFDGRPPLDERDPNHVEPTSAPPTDAIPGATKLTVPSSIRVGRTNCCYTCSTAITMSLETYAKHVLCNEWITSWNSNSLKAGAIAVRSYGAWHVYNPRGSNHDICDTSCCQVYGDSTVASTNSAVDATSGIYVANSGGTIGRAEYSAENNNSCGNCWITNNPSASCLSDSICCGKTLSGHGRGMCQWGTQRWALDGKGWEWICDHYYNNYGWSRQSAAPAWAASYNAQSYPGSMSAGSTATVWAEFRNDGTSAWKHTETRLGTSSPQDRTSPFCTPSNWSGCTRPTDVDQSSVGQGAIGRFTFIITAPTTPGTYTEKYRLVREGVTWFGPEITWTITVNAVVGNLNGTVTNGSTGAGIAGASVTLNGVGTTTTNSSGGYGFSNVTAGSYSMSVSATGFNGTTGSVSIPAGGTATKNYALSPSDTQAPSTPTLLAATATGPTSVQLTWSAATDNVAVAGYDIRRNGAVVGSSGSTSYSDNTAAALSTYSYEVRARDAVPNYSGWSNTLQVTTPPHPPAATTVFTEGFDGSLNNWTQQTANFDYSTAVNHGSYTGGGAAYCAGGQADQMFRQFARPFAGGKVWAWFYDTKGGWKQGVCGYSYRQALSLRGMDNSGMFIDNEFYSATSANQYFYRTLGTGGVGHTAYATRNPNTACTAAWIYFETTVNPGPPGGLGTVQVLVTDGAGTTTAAPAMTANFYDYGIGRVTLGLGASSTNDCYWDDVAFQATPPGVPTMPAPTGITASAITWRFTPADNNFFGTDLFDAAGNAVAPQYPNSGWLNRTATQWTESGLQPNTQYSRKVRTWNGTLNAATFSNTTAACTLSVAPTAASIVPSASAVCTNVNITWTAADGFGPGKVQYYKYAWNTNSAYSFTGSEAVWSGGTIATQGTNAGNWYLHVQGYNAENVANGNHSYTVSVAPATAITAAPANTAACPGGNASFTLTATGGQLSYRWQKGGIDLTEAAPYTGTNTTTLNITGVNAGALGVYRCVVAGICGTVTSPEAELSLKTATAVTESPQSVTICEGLPLNLSVTATGSNLRYQWQRNTANIVGADQADFELAASSPATAGSYRCVVTGDCGTATSAAAVVSVVPLNPMDFDQDCDVDGADFEAFITCAKGPAIAYSAGCAAKDLDADGDVDQADFGLFQRCLSGPGTPAPANCLP